MKRLLFPAFIIFVALALYAADTNGGKSALDALPQKYRAGVMKLSADNGTPNPPTWYIVAKNSNQSGAPYNIAISGGQIVSERISLNLGALVANSPLDLSKVRIGSDDAWNAAQRYSVSKGKKLASVSYALEQHGADSTPIWSVWCYDSDNSYIGLIKILATNGSIVSSE